VSENETRVTELDYDAIRAELAIVEELRQDSSDITGFLDASEGVARYVPALLDRIEVLEGALRQLEGWDMLYLTEDGHGAATADAPWARKLISDALRDLA
jgi:hypothetical protein